MGRRQFMNLLTFGSVTGVALGALYPVVRYFIPPSSGSAGGGVAAKDALGNDVLLSTFTAQHNVGERVLVQGLKGDPTSCVRPWDDVEDPGRKCPPAPLGYTQCPQETSTLA